MGLQFAILSGFCASAASVFGKLSGLSSFEELFFMRIIFFTAMIVSNAGVWTLFVKALHQSDSSLIATVVSSASNYIVSALVGFLIFNEVTSLFWWTGMLFIIIGLALILSDQTENKEEIKSS